MATGQGISKKEAEQYTLLLRREIQRAAARLIKVHSLKALDHANQQVKEMQENGDEEDQVFWEKIAAEVEKQLQQQ